MCWDRWSMDHMNKAMGRAATLELVLCFVCPSPPPTLQSSPPHAQLYQSHQGITSTPLDTPFHPQNNDWSLCKKRQDEISGPGNFWKCQHSTTVYKSAHLILETVRELERQDVQEPPPQSWTNTINVEKHGKRSIILRKTESKAKRCQWPNQ